MEKSEDFDPRRFPTYMVNHTSRLLMRRLEDLLRPFGLGTAYLPVVRSLMGGPLPQKELLAHIPVAQPTLTELLNRMERDGAIVKSPNPEDKRSNLYRLSEETQSRMPEVFAALLAESDRLLRGIDEDEQARLQATLAKICRNLEDID